MGKIYAIYGAALICLVGAMAMVLWSMGLGRGEPPAPELIAEEVPLTYEERVEESLQSDPLFAFMYAKLYDNVAYHAPQAILLYEQPRTDDVFQETLMSNGIFLVEKFLLIDGTGWYRVIVNDGRKNYPMHIKQEDVDPFDPTIYGAPPTAEQIQHRESGRESVRKFTVSMAERGVANEMRKEQIAELENQPEDLERITESARAMAQNVNSQGLMLPIALAAGLALFLMLAIATAIWLKQQHLWSREHTIDELYDSYEREYADDDFGEKPTDDPMEKGDYDLPKSPFE